MFDAFYSDEALELAKWSQNEPNKVKAMSLMKIAQKIERQNRIAFGDLGSGKARDMGGYYLKPVAVPPINQR